MNERDREQMASELRELAELSTGPEHESYRKRYLAIISPTDSYAPVPLPPPAPSSPAPPPPPTRLAIVTGIGYNLPPCPHCGALTAREVAAGRRLEIECTACGFGYDLPATE